MQRRVSLEQLRIVLFFSRGSTIEGWKKSGTLKRDLLLYRGLRKKGIVTDLITYGLTEKERIVQKEFSIYGKRKSIGNLVYGFTLPIRLYKMLSTCSLLKTHQIEGSLFAVLA